MASERSGSRSCTDDTVPSQPTDLLSQPGTLPDQTHPLARGSGDIPRRRRANTDYDEAGYEIGEAIGRGGMGEVVLAHDARIGRDVALKRMHSDDPHLYARFMREAKIQARLDHPAIVPVYELGRDAQGRPYFTMKRLAGRTLYAVLADTTIQQPLQRLLRAFVDVCRAIEFAHARGIVHRDLKPSNIMLGNFGEVYVLDWGIARVLVDGSPSGHGIETVDRRDPMISTSTHSGSILGTPGYVAPEQLRGDPVGPGADVYSLGAILFEILAGEALHPRELTAAIASTLLSPSSLPSARAPRRGIAPELDAICLAALDGDSDRRPSAHVLAERIQAFLDGDRDLARRRTLAAHHVAVARHSLANGLRADAVQAAGRALALDPGSTEAATLVSSLMLAPPTDHPPQLEERLRTVERELGVHEARTAAFALCTYFLFLPFVIWVGVRDYWVIAAVFGFVAFQVGYAVWMWKSERVQLLPALVLNIVLMVLLTRLFGPVMVIPGLVGTFAVVSVQQSQLIDRPFTVIAISIASLLVPIALETIGVLAPSWDIVDGSLVIHPTAISFDGTRATLFIVACNIAFVVVTTLFGRMVAAQRREAMKRLEVHAWHLRQLVPGSMPMPPSRT